MRTHPTTQKDPGDGRGTTHERAGACHLLGHKRNDTPTLAVSATRSGVHQVRQLHSLPAHRSEGFRSEQHSQAPSSPAAGRSRRRATWPTRRSDAHGRTARGAKSHPRLPQQPALRPQGAQSSIPLMTIELRRSRSPRRRQPTMIKKTP